MVVPSITKVSVEVLSVTEVVEYRYVVVYTVLVGVALVSHSWNIENGAWVTYVVSGVDVVLK